jgi:6-phosphogluconolactonase
MTADTGRKLIVVENDPALAETAAQRLIDRVVSRDRAAVCLTGGSSPEGLYRLLGQEPWRAIVPWGRVHWFIGDDRFVPDSDALSNMGMAQRLFLGSVPVPPQNVHPMATEAKSPDDAARLYENDLKRFYGADTLDPSLPLFDLVLMGLGSDGHTASLFPHSPALDEKQRWVVGVTKAGMEPYVPRVTLTFPTLASTREMLFLVESPGKRELLGRVLSGGAPRSRAPGQAPSGDALPAQRAYSNGELVWLVTRDAASKK